MTATVTPPAPAALAEPVPAATCTVCGLPSPTPECRTCYLADDADFERRLDPGRTPTPGTGRAGSATSPTAWSKPAAPPPAG
jgi:hypothetical protein